MDLEVFGVSQEAIASSTGGNTIGPCPFTQSVLMALEERKLPYEASYVEEGANQPHRLREHNPSGTLPALRDHNTWICDSNKIDATKKIFEYINAKYPEQSESMAVPSGLKPHIEKILSALFGTFTEWLESRNKYAQAGADYAKAAEALNSYLLGQHLYMAGSHVTDADCELFPKLRHARATLLRFMDFDIPLELAGVHRYIELMENNESFRRTYCGDEQVLEYYQKEYDLRVPLEQIA